MNTTRRTHVQRILTRTAGTLCLFGAIACILLVAIGGAYPSEKHGVRVVVPRTGDVWQVGELHTVQWTLNGMPTRNSSGEPLMAIFILSYASGAPDSHVLLGHLTDWFPITDRLANIMVPSVPTREDYSLYMFSHDNRDVSSWSGALTIFNPENVEGIEEPANTLVVTTAPPVSVTISLTSTFSDSELSSSLLSRNYSEYEFGVRVR
ncbi:hypothetical protein C8Q80DRAFT_1354900 [Daedaleopsis nitida]|nr:hypothetical protein C8Q80DRAFT_1354900 [Daedaleopsis nitida]